MVPLELVFCAFSFLFSFMYIGQKVGRVLSFVKGHQKLDLKTDVRKKKIRKFKEPWFTDTKNIWVGPGDQVWPDQQIKVKLKALYMYAAGFYTYSIFALIFWETRRTDFGVSMTHHVASVILIVLSYTFRFASVGSVVLVIHDGSDVFLEIEKMSKYSDSESEDEHED